MSWVIPKGRVVFCGTRLSMKPPLCATRDDPAAVDWVQI
jgi:hypothetical protein